MSKITNLTEATSLDNANDWLVAVDVSDTTQSASGTNKKIKPSNLGVGGALEYQTAITTNTILDGTQKGLNNVYPVDSSSAVTITIEAGDYVENDVINIERRGTGSVQIVQGSGVRFRGVRDINNEFFINDVGIVSLLCRGGDEFTIIGRLTGGYTGAVTTSNYTQLLDTGLAQDVTVSGSGFSDNMSVTLTGNATLNTVTVNSPTECVLNITETGTSGDQITVEYDNGDLFTDTNAITIIAPNDFSAAVGVWSLRDIYNGWSNGVVQLERSSDSDTQFIYFNGSGEIDGTSLVGATATSASATTLSAWLGSDNAIVTRWVMQFQNDTYDSSYDLIAPNTAEPTFATSGTLETKNGKNVLKFSGSENMETTSFLSECVSGQIFSIVSVAHNDTNDAVGVIWSLRQDAGNGGVISYSDRRTTALGGQLINDAGGANVLNFLATDNTANQKVQTITVDGSDGTINDVWLHLDSTQQENLGWGGTYDTDPFQIGLDKSNTLPLTGGIQEIALFDSDIRSNLSTIVSNIDTYYTIP